MSIDGTVDYVGVLLAAIVDGRIEAKDVKEMTPEQRQEYMERLVKEEEEIINRELSKHSV